MQKKIAQSPLSVLISVDWYDTLGKNSKFIVIYKRHTQVLESAQLCCEAWLVSLASGSSCG